MLEEETKTKTVNLLTCWPVSVC